MLLKSIFTCLIFSLLSVICFGQLKVHSSGSVSIGTTTSTGFLLEVAGYNAIKITYAGSYMRFSPATANGVISSTADRIAFWESTNGHHQLDASLFYVTSDSTLKTDIEPLDTGMSKLMSLEPCTYYYKDEYESGESKLRYGFVAQEIQQIYPEIVDSSMGVLAINYDAIIPILVMGIQTQQTTIDSLGKRLTELENEIYGGGIKPKSQEVLTTPDGQFVELGQNNPNPFKESTTISYSLPSTTMSAQIIIYDLQGLELESYQLSSFGEGQLIIDGSTFKPGMYLYALIVDGNYIDSKKMILTK